MLSKKGKMIFTIATVACVIGCTGFLYVGFSFFGEKPLVLWVFNIYIVGLAGVVLFMVYRYIKGYIT